MPCVVGLPSASLIILAVALVPGELQMTRIGCFFCMMMIGIAIAGECAPQRGDRSTKTTVCEISANPLRFTGKTVMFSGQYESDGIERSVLTDNKCKDVGIAVSAPAHFKGEADLMKALRLGHPGTLDKTISGTFSGKFEWHPRKNPKRVLTLTEVRNVSAAMK